MPIFEYSCTSCKRNFEKLLFSSDETNITCPDCDSEDVEKKISAASIINASVCSSNTPGGFS